MNNKENPNIGAFARKNNQKKKALIEICKRLIRSTHIAKSLGESSTTWAMSSTLNFVKSLQKPNARLVPIIGQMELVVFFAQVEIVYYSQKRQGRTKAKFDLLSMPCFVISRCTTRKDRGTL